MLISIIGYCGYFAQVIIRGVILNPTGYYISLVAGITTHLSSVGLKSYLSKIVDHSELGKVFTLMAVLDATAPILASSLFAYVFKCTIDAFPGLCFLILGAISLIPIWVAMSIDIYFLESRNDTKKSNNTDVKNLC
jgi:MFS-type transporter involved in bile tolerance (Atg22 family)